MKSIRKKSISFGVAFFFSICFVGPIFGQVEANEPKDAAVDRAKRPSFVKTADFYLRNGLLVSGKIIQEDKDKIVLEQVKNSNIVVVPYGKREIDLRTMHTKSTLEYNYYLDLADLFSAAAWDFENDPDDFTQAIRSLEKAAVLLEDSAQPEEKILEVKDRIKKLQNDRRVWIRETSDRAEQKKLEFDATIVTKLEEFEKKLNENDMLFKKTIQQLEETAETTKDQYQQYQKNNEIRYDSIIQQINMLDNRINANTELFNRSRHYYYQPYYYKQNDSD